MLYEFVLIVCFKVSAIDCREIKVKDRVEWCAKIEQARDEGELWNAFVLRLDRNGSRESYERGCK
jgi:hypothetical protein